MLTDRERTTFADRHPRSAAAYARADHLFGRVPMTWMNKSAAGYPVYLDRARGARLTDIDGHEYVDFCLGDTAAMAGHSPAPVVAAVTRRLADLGGAATMVPTEDAALVGAELSRRFGLPAWSFELTATDAQPLGGPAAAGRHRPPPHPGQQLLLPRLGRRIADRRRSRRPAAQPGGQRRRPR